MGDTTLITGGTIVTAEGEYCGDVLIEGETISAVGRVGPPTAQSTTVIDASGCFVLPGLIDNHTHLSMPFMGMMSSDDYDTGTRAAAAGGVTCLVDFAIQHAREALDGFGDWHILACAPGELLRDGERLREETLNLARARHGQLILIRKLFHPQDGDDVLKILVALEDTLHAERNPVMLLAHDIRVEDAAG